MSQWKHTFTPFISTIHGFKYTKTSYYQYQLYNFFKTYPKATNKEAQAIFQSNIQKLNRNIQSQSALDWTSNTFGNKCSIAKRQIRDQPPILAPTRRVFKSNEQQIAYDSLKSLFEHSSLDEIYGVLNRYSNHKFLGEHWGDDIQAQSNIKWTLKGLTKKYKYSVAQKAKQSILSSMIELDADRKLTNGKFIYRITDGKINKSLIDKIIDLKWKFDNDESV